MRFRRRSRLEKRKALDEKRSKRLNEAREKLHLDLTEAAHDYWKKVARAEEAYTDRRRELLEDFNAFERRLHMEAA